LEAAIETDELFLVYQPFLDLRENRITGFEALLRWRHPARGLVSPPEFIALAEESGLIHPIGDWVVRHACQALAQWPANIRVAVNVSAVQFQNANILQTFVKALADSRVAPGRLEIEITESILLSKYDSAASVLNSLLELGVTVGLMTSEQATHPSLTCADCRSVASKSTNPLFVTCWCSRIALPS
jgi:EAL domain-containing protein (putative c-di-GMP-specific phosphodiesterase class I)